MSSANTSYTDHAVDLYYTIYGNETERQSDVYTQNNMELFEKVWVAGAGTTATEPEEQDEKNKSVVDEEPKGPEGSEESQEQVEESASNIPSDWPEIPDQGPSSMLWTCDVCEKQMSIFFRTEHLATEHPHKGKLTLRTRKSKKKADCATWQCELCDEEVNIFYTVEHIAGKKHVMKLKESGEYQYVPPPEDFVEQRAVYKPQEGEEVLAEAGEGGEEEEEDEYWDPAEIQGTGAYQEDSAVYRPKDGEEVHVDLEPDGNRGAGEKLEQSAGYQPEDKEEDDWEAEDNTIYALAGEPWGQEGPRRAEASYTPASIQYQQQPPPGQSSRQNYLRGVVSSEQPLSQPSYQSYVPVPKVLSSQPLPDPRFYQSYVPNQPPPRQQFYQSYVPNQPPLSQTSYQSHVPNQPPLGQTSYQSHVPNQPPPIQPSYQSYLPKAASNQPPSSQQSYQNYPPNVTSSQSQTPAIPHGPQVPFHIQVETFYCDLCDTEYPMSEQKYHPERVFECTICDEVLHANNRKDHLAGKKHMKHAAAQGITVQAAIPKVPAPRVPVPKVPAPKAEASQKKKEGKFRCELCRKTMSMDSRASHLRGKKHKNKEEAVAATEAAKKAQRKASNAADVVQEIPEKVAAPSGFQPFISPEGKLGKFYCGLCQMSMGVDSRDAHLAGTKHQECEAAKAKEHSLRSASTDTPLVKSFFQRTFNTSLPAPPDFVKPADDNEKFHCVVCDLTIGVGAQQGHLRGLRHKANEAMKAAQAVGAAEAVSPKATNNTLNENFIRLGQAQIYAPQEWGSPVRAAGGQNEAAGSSSQVMQDGGGKFHCLICNLTMYAHNRECHLNGIDHNKNVAQAAATKNLGVGKSGPSAPLSPARPPTPPETLIFHCELCNLTMAMDCRRSHLGGKKHRKSELERSAAAPSTPPPPPVVQQKSSAVPIVPALPKTAATKPGAAKNIVTEMMMTKVDGDVVVEVLKVEPDIRTDWCQICQMDISQERDNHRSEAWECGACQITIHAEWKDMHLSTAHLSAETRGWGYSFGFL